MEHLHAQVTVRLFLEEKSFGPGPMRLLMGVEETGSLHKSAQKMGMAYSKAWTLLKRLENQWGFPLIIRRTGGNSGGGSQLTVQGKNLLERYKKMTEEVEQLTKNAFQKYFPEGWETGS